jgi:hypothetical protein
MRFSGGLSEREQSILDFERGSWQISGPKEAAIRREMGMSTTRYYQVLGELIDDPAAYDYDPLLIRRLRIRRDERLRRKFVGHEAGPRQR